MKQSQESVGFEDPARGPHNCDACKWFLWDMACRKVEGSVYPEDWCRLWEKDEA